MLVFFNETFNQKIKKKQKQKQQNKNQIKTSPVGEMHFLARTYLLKANSGLLKEWFAGY